jgi:hypothetical protein
MGSYLAGMPPMLPLIESKNNFYAHVSFVCFVVSQSTLTL